MSEPVICFGQQPCGFFPKRFLVAKIRTARRLQREIGGRIVFFYHDSDHDPRETLTILHHRTTGAEARLNFTFANPIQRKWSPLYAKRVVPGWKENLLRQLPAYAGVAENAAAAVAAASAQDVASFCLEAYGNLGLLEGIEVVRSGDGALRRRACAVDGFFVDVSYQGEIVRARAAWPSPGVANTGGPDAPSSVPSNEGSEPAADVHRNMALRLHQGGNAFIELPPVRFTAEQISPTRDTRLKWMQSIIHCTHYVCGAGEQAYLRKEDAPEIVYVPRMSIDRADEAYTAIGLGQP